MFLDMMASRWASALALVLVATVSVASFGFVRQGENSAQQAKALFDGPTVRQTAQAVADIYRLGFALEYAVSRVLCDARILNIFEGAAEIQAQVIARRLLETRGNQ